MDFAQYFPIWDKLSREQQERLHSVTEFQKVKSGTVLHNQTYIYTNITNSTKDDKITEKSSKEAMKSYKIQG